MRFFLAALTVVLLAACTSVQVTPVATSAHLKRVCIVFNPKVEVQDFVSVLRDGFSRHGIATTVVSSNDAKGCNTTLTYSARRSWDVAPYLSKAWLRLWRDGQQIGAANYHLVGGGGLTFSKYEGTKTKMDPVIDKLLKNVK